MILLTGFEPFDGATTNPTAQLVEHVASLRLTDVAARVLPTSYRRSEAAVTAAVRELRPRVVCMLGLHAGATTLRFEQVALNLNQAGKPDNDGELRCAQRIRETGPVGYFSTLPFEPMRQLAEHAGENLEVSRDAGGFVCNHVFYTVSEILASELPEASAGFVHVPPLDALRLSRVSKVLEAWIDLFRGGANQTRA
jgi:pyroglutamyl-peptidase